MRQRTYRVEVYQDRKYQFRWRLVSHNGNIVADSAESYTRRTDATRAAHKVMDTIAGGYYEYAE